MKSLIVFRKTMLEMLREPQLLALELLMPLFMLGIVWVGYANVQRQKTHPVLLAAEGAHAAPLTEHIASEQYASGRPVFELRPVLNLDEADTALKQKAATVLLIIQDGADGQPVIITRGDATSMEYINAGSLLDGALASYLDELAGITPPLRFRETSLAQYGPQTELDAYTPGMIIFATLLLIPQTAMLLGREVRKGTLRRLRLTQLNSRDLLTGISLAQMLVAAGQVVIMFAAALLFGFHNHGSLLLAIGVGLLLSFSSIGLGLVTACFSNNDSDALNLGATFSMLQVFLSGAFFAMPPLTVFHLAGYEIGLFDFIPATHGLLALQQVLISGSPLSAVTFRLVAMTVLSLLYFALGILVFGKLRMASSELRTAN